MHFVPESVGSSIPKEPKSLRSGNSPLRLSWPLRRWIARTHRGSNCRHPIGKILAFPFSLRRFLSLSLLRLSDIVLCKAAELPDHSIDRIVRLPPRESVRPISACTFPLLFANRCKAISLLAQMSASSSDIRRRRIAIASSRLADSLRCNFVANRLQAILVEIAPHRKTELASVFLPRRGAYNKKVWIPPSLVPRSP